MAVVYITYSTHKFDLADVDFLSCVSFGRERECKRHKLGATLLHKTLSGSCYVKSAIVSRSKTNLNLRGALILVFVLNLMLLKKLLRKLMMFSK